MKCFSFILCVVWLTAACAASPAQQVDFRRDIAPILEDRCWDCHGEDEQESGLRLDRRADMLRGGDYGFPAVVPGKPKKSYLVEVVKHLAEGFAPVQDRFPGQAGLEGIQDDMLEPLAVVMDRNAPLIIMVALHQ